MLINVLRDEQPTHVAVAFDVSRKTFRTEEYSEYKAKRNKTPDEFSSQLPLIEAFLDALYIPFLKKPGYEADDIIATLVTQAVADDMDVLIVSGDRDSFQLVSERSTVLYPMRGVSELARMTPEAVQDKYGVPPERYPEIAALVGETSDNLPGVPGVGVGLRRQVDQPVRRPRQRDRPRRRDHRQEGRGAARAPGRRDPQPPAQRTGLRPRPREGPGGPQAAGVEPSGGPGAARRAGVPGRAADPDPRRPGAGGGAGGGGRVPARRHHPRPGRRRSVARGARQRTRGPPRARHAGAVAPGGSWAWVSPWPTVAPPMSTSRR